MEGNLLTYISESYFEQQKTSKNSITAHTNKLFAYAMRGLGLSCAVGLLLVPLLLVSRCPTQVVFNLLGMLESFTLNPVS